MNIVERLSDGTTCDQRACPIATGELFVTGSVEVPISCDGATDIVPVIAMCARCAEVPNGFQPGWDLYNVSEFDLLDFADDNLHAVAKNSPGDLEMSSAMHTIASVRKYLLARTDEEQYHRHAVA
jgi:hypothetical protein